MIYNSWRHTSFCAKIESKFTWMTAFALEAHLNPFVNNALYDTLSQSFLLAWTALLCLTIKRNSNSQLLFKKLFNLHVASFVISKLHTFLKLKCHEECCSQYNFNTSAHLFFSLTDSDYQKLFSSAFEREFVFKRKLDFL